ncbi:hypothetical protein EKK58_02440 [Candidatus Dependentiae bacterium]|nr:MAG: hypothetical protein EKK58_02440 [Candidatus Dependentiae bacterium]
MKQYANKCLLLAILSLFTTQKTYPMGLFKIKTLKTPTGLTYAKNKKLLPVHKVSKNNIHIFAHKHTKQPLAFDIHQKAYNLSLNHEFPTAPHYNTQYNPTICQTKALQDALDQENSEIEALWIPKTLYELFIIHEYENNYTKYKGYTGDLDNSDLKELLTINQDADNITLHKQVNEAILLFLHQHPYQETQPKEAYWINLAEHIINQLPIEIKELKEEILNAIKQEYHYHKHHPETFLLYRSGPLNQKDFNKEANYALNHTKNEKPGLPKHISLSFGAGFLSAYCTDHGACSAKILCKETKPYAYTLPINKKDTIDHKNPFFVPPLAAIPSFFSKGEAFHARTKTAGYVAKPDGWCTNKSHFPKILSTPISLNPFHTAQAKHTYYKNLYRSLIQKAIPLNKPTENLIASIKKELPE